MTYIAIIKKPPCELINFCVTTTESRAKIWYQAVNCIYYYPSGLGCWLLDVDSLFIVAPSVFGSSVFCYSVLIVLSSFVIILIGEVHVAGCFTLIVDMMSCDCLYSVALLHSAGVVLQCVIVVHVCIS